MRFKDWLRETSTSTGDIANFSRVAIGPANFRMYPEPLVMAIDRPKKRRRLAESRQWAPATPDDYSSLFVIADYVEDHPEKLNEWFRQFRDVVVGFANRCD